MPEPEKDVNNPDLVNQEGAEGSSPEQEPEGEGTGTPTPQEGGTQEPEGRVPYERFKQVNDEKKWYQQQLEALLQKQQQLIQPQETQQAQPDPFANMGSTPEEREFIRQMRELSRKEAEALLKQKEEQFQKALQAQQQIIGNLLTRDFRRAHPEIKPGSEEEARAAQLIQRGYDPDDAAKLAMYDKLQTTAQERTQRREQQRTQAKKQANVENTSIPPQSGLPQKKQSFREYVSQLYDEELRKGWE